MIGSGLEQQDDNVTRNAGRNTEMNRTLQVGKKKVSKNNFLSHNFLQMSAIDNHRRTISLYAGGGAKTHTNFFSKKRMSSNQYRMVGSKPKEINISSLFAKEMSMNSKRFSHQ